MPDPPEPVADRIVRWAERRPDVRAVLLTSSRAVSGRPADAFSDWDVIVYAQDPVALLGTRDRPRELGEVLLELPPEGASDPDAWPHPTRLVLYRDGTKIDFTVPPVADLENIADAETLPDELEAGFVVLFDRTGLTDRLPEPTGRAYLLEKPTQAAFSAVVEEFLWEATYVAKHLARGDLLPARYCFTCVMQVELLRRMLEWRVACDRGWDRRAGVLGRGLLRRLDPERRATLEEAVLGPDAGARWDALFRVVELFRDAAVEVAASLGLDYPHQTTDEVVAYLERVRRTSPEGTPPA